MDDLATIDTTLDCRAATFENPTGARGAGGTAHGGRKGAPSRRLAPGDSVVLADLDGPGTVRHIWMTFPPGPPEEMRAVWMEVFYDGGAEPSVSVPCLDFFGVPHGRPVPYSSMLASMQEARGFNSYVPMPFASHMRIELHNSSTRPIELYYQIDYTLEAALPDRSGLLHVTFRRENPTTLRRDFTIVDGLVGPGRFLGCNVGVRVIDEAMWYGEGEVKVFRDGDGDLPTICGTGLEDYVGTAWGMGPHNALYDGAPLEVRSGGPNPEFVGFYRWHVADPIVFADALRVTIQQIGMASFRAGQEDAFARYRATNPAAGRGWADGPTPGVLGWGLAERVDDYCATAFVYCRDVQAVPRLDVAEAVADIGRLPHESPSPIEAFMSSFLGG